LDIKNDEIILRPKMFKVIYFFIPYQYSIKIKDIHIFLLYYWNGKITWGQRMIRPPGYPKSSRWVGSRIITLGRCT
jgi:hypothetical protein